MRSILFLIEAIQRKQLGRNYLKNKKSFLNFFLHFQNLIADFFPKLRTPENVVRSLSKKPRFAGPFDR